MKIKKLSAVLAGVMVASTLAGCGSTKENSDLKTVRIWTGNSHSKTVVSRLVEEFNKERGKELGVNVVYEVKAGDAGQSIELAYETGEEPEFCQGGNMTQLAETGKIVAIEDMPGGEEFLAEYDPQQLLNFKVSTMDNKTYAAPYTKSVVGLIYNKDMFKAAGLVDENGEPTPPKTYDEMREYAKKLTNKDKQEFGAIVPLKPSWIYGVAITNLAKSSSNTEPYDWTTGKYDYSSHIPVMEMWKGIQDDGSMFPGILNMDDDAARAQFAQGKIGMKVGASFDCAVFTEQFPAVCDWGVAPLPSLTEDERYATSAGVNSILYINKKAVDLLGEETAMEIYKWFHGDEMMSALYAEGMDIPAKASIVENTKLNTDMKGWKEFAELSTLGYNPVWKTPGVLNSGKKGSQEYFLNEFWTGKMTAQEMVKELNEGAAVGMANWFEKNPDQKIEDYIDPDYNTKLEEDIYAKVK